MPKNLRQNARVFLKDTFYDLSILLLSHLVYQTIAQLLN
ncbi:hypothetical protein JOD16_000601 [Enterococcus xiangfangensis]|nr:hypothetical protein [Enterococcus xiangfangensis]